MHGVILAGGSGTRFWPRSRERFPKQFLTISGNETLLQGTVNRLLPLIPIERMLLVTHALHAFEACRQLADSGFSPHRLLAEPVGKNTAAAIGFAARVLAEEDPDAVMGVFPADHIVSGAEKFRDILKIAAQAAKNDHLVTLGIPPQRPESGYGYIRKGAALDKSQSVYKAERFVEKPDTAVAQQFITEGNYFWNCGVFVWKVSRILEAIRTYLPALHSQLDGIVAHTLENKKKYPFRVLDAEGAALYRTLPSISIDHAVLEKSDRVALVPADIRWSDVGCWTALDDVLPKDKNGNVATPNAILKDCTGTIVQGEERIVAALGLKDQIVVDTLDALLVCSKEHAQDVKQIVETLKKDNRPEAHTPATVQKPWGSYTVLEKRSGYLVKRLDVLPGKQLSLQSHDHRSEHWTVVQGTAQVHVDDKLLLLETNQSVFIPQQSRHRLGNPKETPLTLIEVQIGGKIDEDDITRYLDDYDRC